MALQVLDTREVGPLGGSGSLEGVAAPCLPGHHEEQLLPLRYAALPHRGHSCGVKQCGRDPLRP
jgi:hypothetical protein